MNMGLENGHDAEISFGSPGKVAVDITARVDDRNLAGDFVGDEVGNLSE